MILASRAAVIAGVLTLLGGVGAMAQPVPAPAAKPQDTEQWTPVPRVVTPGAEPNAAPSDAVVLFGGGSLDAWVQTNDKSPARWRVADGVLTVDKKAGNIETKRRFRNFQLHLEWRVPEGIAGAGQARGNSGVFLASTGSGDDGYELQILDSYENATYVNGQAGALYKQSPPLVNAMRPPGAGKRTTWSGPRPHSRTTGASPLPRA